MKIIKKNGLHIPDHLTVIFFKRALDLSHGVIKQIVFSPGCADGDSFTSLLYRAKVFYSVDGVSTKIVSLIIKCIPVDGDREIFRIMDVYGKELNMYMKVLPEVEKMLESKNISGKIAPRLIYKQDSPVGTIVFEDLNDLNLVLGNRTQGLDEEHTKMILQKIGQFHAATMVLALKKPYLMKLFNQPTIDHNAQYTVRDKIFRQNIGDMADLVENWEGFEEIARKLRIVKNDFYDRVTRCVSNGEAFKVLNHGDLWVNNCMFKRSHGHPKNLVFIDFQLSYYGSPIFDLHYFLNTSVQLNVLINKRCQLLETYYNALQSTLEAFNFKQIPSKEEFFKEILKKEFISFWAFEAFLPLLTIDKTTCKNSRIESFNNEDEARKKREIMFSSERFIQTIRYSLHRFDKLGVFD